MVVERLEAMAVGAVEAAARAKAAARAQEEGARALEDRARALEDKLAKVESERAALVARLESMTESRAVAKVTAREIAGRLDRAVGEVRAALGR
jgi:hypothetical protein